jgi:multicomponent K+:H+ antiporter subunit D
VALSAWPRRCQRYTDAAAAQLLDRAAYARAVLGERGATEVSTRPYRFSVPPAAGGPA